jgi:aquaporin Z
LGIGFVGVALAFGLTVLTMAAPFAGGWALDQLWLFSVAPLIGAVIGGAVYRWVGGDEPRPVEVSGTVAGD